MEQNVALEMFGYLKEHFVGLAKDKGDEVIEGSEFIQGKEKRIIASNS